MAASRVLLVADDPLAKAGIGALLASEPEVRVVAQAGLEEVPGALAGGPIDVVCWDPGTGEAEAARLVEAVEGAPVLALLGLGAGVGAGLGAGPGTGSGPGAGARASALLLLAGVRALVDRASPGPALAAALHAAARGFTVLDRREARAVLRPPPAQADGGEPGSALTAREGEVLGLLAEGHSNKVIAARLAISEHTAKFHVNAILGKLGAATRAEAVAVAARRGLLLL